MNNAIHCGNSFHSEKSPGPLWGEVISPDNGLDLLNTVKLTAVKQLHYSSERKKGLGASEEVWARKESLNSSGGRHSECIQGSQQDSRLLCGIWACNHRKKLGE